MSSITTTEIGRVAQDVKRPPMLTYPVAMLSIVLTFWTVDIVAPALPEIKHDLSLTAAGAGLVFSIMFAGRLIGNFPAGWMLVRQGAAATALLGGVVLTTGSVFASIADTEYFLYGARFVQGVGISLIVNATLRSILHARPGSGAAMTLFGFAATVGGIFGLYSGGYLAEGQGWRSIFWVSTCLAGAVALLAAVAAGLRPGRRMRQGSAEVDPGHAVASSESGTMPWADLAPVLLLNFLVLANYSIWVALPLYTEDELGLTPGQNANLLLVITFVHLVAAFPVGRNIRSRGASITLLFGLMVTIIGTLGILAAPSRFWMVLPLVAYSAGQVAAVTAAGDLVLQRGGLGAKTVVNVRLSGDLGLVLGPWVTGLIADEFGYGAPFLFWPVMMVAAVILAAREYLQQDAES